MKKLLHLILIFTTTIFYGQKALFDTLKIDSKTKIIGRYAHTDKSRTYEKYNFIIEDSTAIKNFINTLKLGEEVPNSFDRINFRLTVVKDHEEIGSWTISPTRQIAMTHDGHTYKFDLSKISELNRTNPFTYYYEIKVFNKKTEYEQYLNIQKNNPNYLFHYGPQFEFEGSFEIEFLKSEQFSSPKAISDYLKPLVEKIVNEDDYRIGYIANEKNIHNQNQFTMTITGSKKLFDKLQLKNLKKENWKATVEDGYFFYRK
jgi:hypothetical protein